MRDELLLRLSSDPNFKLKIDELGSVANEKQAQMIVKVGIKNLSKKAVKDD